jgi:hypothetical protein
MLVQPEGETAARRGLLIDFDYAALVETAGERVISTGFRTVRPLARRFKFDYLYYII